MPRAGALLAAIGLTATLTIASGSVATGSARPSGGTATAATSPHWQTGYRAGTTTFSNANGATCKPKLATKDSDRRCRIAFSGRFRATDAPYHGTYTGSAFLRWTAGNSVAQFEGSPNLGSVTYRIYNANNVLVSTVTAYIDSGSGFVDGYPYDLSVAYEYEERNEEAGFVRRPSGVGVNQLSQDLLPIRTFVDRLVYQ